MDESDEYQPRASLVRERLGVLGGAEALLIAQQYLRAGEFAAAKSVVEASEGVDLASFEVCVAALWVARGELERAREHVALALERNPECLPARSLRVQLYERAGNRSLAVAELRRIVARFPDYPGALSTLAGWLMPGAHYREVLEFVHSALRPRCYLEVGVETGATLAMAHQAEHAVGVDPRPNLRVTLPQNARVFELESDTFFAQESCASVFGDGRADLTFIDGMHRFEFALRDFAHAEAWSHPGATIVLHDALVIAEACAERERRSKFWVGDVYKVLSVLEKERPDLRIRWIPTPPSGLVVIRRLDPNSRRLLDQLDALEERYRDVPPLVFPEAFQNRALDSRLQLVSNDEAGYRKALEL